MAGGPTGAEPQELQPLSQQSQDGWQQYRLRNSRDRKPPPCELLEQQFVSQVLQLVSQQSL